MMLALAGCYYDVEEELYPDTGCDTAQISFAADVLPIIENRCYKCHDAASNFGNVTLEGYDNLLVYANNGKLLGVIRREPGYSPMPKNEPPLLECEIAKIEAWIQAGAPNN